MELRMSLRIAALWTIASLSCHQSISGSPLTESLRVGGAVPKHVVQESTSDGSVASGGKHTTVVWFWASWCEPCVAHAASYDRLVEKYASSSVTFVAVSPESPEQVNSFLKRVPLKGWVLADPEGLLTGAFDIKVYPTTLVVTSGDAIALRVTGEAVTDGVVGAAASGRPVVVPVLSGSKKEAQPDRSSGTSSTDTDRDVLRARISISPPSAERGVRSRISLETSGFHATRATLSTLIEQAYGVEPWQLEWEVLQPTERFDAVVELPGDELARWRGLLRNLVSEGLGLSIIREKRHVTSYALMGTSEHLSRSAPSDTESKFVRGPGTLDGTRVDLDGLCVVLGQILDARFGNAVLSKDFYNIHLEWAPEKQDSLIEAVEKLGFTVRVSSAVEDHIIVRVATCGA